MEKEVKDKKVEALGNGSTAAEGEPPKSLEDKKKD